MPGRVPDSFSTCCRVRNEVPVTISSPRNTASAKGTASPSRWALGVMVSDAPLMGIIFTVLPPILPLIAVHFGGSQQGRLMAQMVMTLPSLGLIVGGAVGGWLVDRWGVRSVLFVGLLGYGLFGSAGLYLDSAASLLVSRFLLGVAATAITTATAWMLAESYAADRRTHLLGYRNSLGSFAGIVTTFLAGPIAEHAGWRAPFAFYLVSLGILMVALLSLPRFTHRAEAETGSAVNVLLPLWPIYVIAVLLYVVIFAPFTQLSFLLSDEGINRPSVQSWVIGMGSVGTTLSAASYGRIKTDFGVHFTLVLLIVLLGTGNVLVGLTHTAVGGAVGIGVAGLGGGLAVPCLCDWVLDRAPVEVRGRAVGLLYSAMFFGDFLSPIFFHPLGTMWGAHGAFVVLGGTVMASALVVGFLKKQLALQTA